MQVSALKNIKLLLTYQFSFPFIGKRSNKCKGRRWSILAFNPHSERGKSDVIGKRLRNHSEKLLGIYFLWLEMRWKKKSLCSQRSAHVHVYCSWKQLRYGTSASSLCFHFNGNEISSTEAFLSGYDF